MTIILTHAFMLLSAPQCFGVFAYALQTLLLLYYRKRIVDFLTSQYIPHLPVDGVTGEREESPLY